MAPAHPPRPPLQRRRHAAPGDQRQHQPRRVADQERRVQPQHVGVVQRPHQRRLAQEHVEGRRVGDALEVADLDGAGAPVRACRLGAVDLWERARELRGGRSGGGGGGGGGEREREGSALGRERKRCVAKRCSALDAAGLLRLKPTLLSRLGEFRCAGCSKKLFEDTHAHTGTRERAQSRPEATGCGSHVMGPTALSSPFLSQNNNARRRLTINSEENEKTCRCRRALPDGLEDLIVVCSDRPGLGVL